MGEKYLTIKLTLTQLNKVKPEEFAKARYRARIEQSPRGASDGPGCDFKLTAKDWTALNQFIARMPTKSLGKSEVRDLGQKLYSLIIKDEVEDKYQECVGSLRDGGRLRLALAILSEHLIRIPWEYLDDGKGHLLQSNSLIVRIIDTLEEKKAPFSPIGRLLVAIANPNKNNPDAQFAPFAAQAHEEQLVERLKLAGIEYHVLHPCKRKQLEDQIRGGDFDALYFVGHGVFTTNLEGQLILEDDKNGEDTLDAALLAQWLSNPYNKNQGRGIRFAYLNSCSTAKNTSANPFAGTAQRLMRDGKVDAVVAMQTNVEQTAALNIAVSFFEELQLQRGNSPEQALALARFKGDDSHTWGVPSLYSYLSGPEDFERNRLAYFLSATPGETSYGIFLPTFIFGALVGEIKGEIKLDPPQKYFYEGETLALEDVESGLDVIRLLTRIVPPEQIKLWRATDQKMASCSHWFIFGSRSNKIVQNVLGKDEYSPRFKFDYAPAGKPGKWMLKDTKYSPAKSYYVDAPHKGKKGEYDEKDDIGVIEKIVPKKLGYVFFLLSGLGDRATRGCGWHLYKNWDALLREFGNSPFGITLKFPGGFPFSAAERLD